MDLKFSFGASNPLPISGAGSLSAPPTPSSVLELRVSLSADGGLDAATDDVSDATDGGSVLVCEALSGDGVSYARAMKRPAGDGPAALAAALRSALARCGAELPEPLLGSVTGVVLDLGGLEVAALEALGLRANAAPAMPGSQLAAVDAALQARTGVAAGTPITAA